MSSTAERKLRLRRYEDAPKNPDAIEAGFIWADGVYLQARMEHNAECMLVLIGATPEGKKELVGFLTGSARSRA